MERGGNGDLTAYELAQALGGRRNGAKGWLCRCPSHDDRHPSLALTERDSRVLLHCWSGCSQGEIIAALRQRGLWRGRETTIKPRRMRSDPPDESTRRDPLKAWRRASPLIAGTAVERYLASRGLLLPDDTSSLRFTSDLWHWPSQSRWPAMLAKVARADGSEITVHQTFLAANGRGKAPIDKPRLFPAGASPEGGGVWFGKADPDREFVVAEGVESLLAAMAIYGAAAGCAALSAGGVRALNLPPEARRARIVADHDHSGLAAAREAYRRWRAEGREVRVSTPDADGGDANDVWLGRMRAAS
jgi:putative DNA primase/helicase